MPNVQRVYPYSERRFVGGLFTMVLRRFSPINSYLNVDANAGADAVYVLYTPGQLDVAEPSLVNERVVLHQPHRSRRSSWLTS